jgi:hypothetical protein
MPRTDDLEIADNDLLLRRILDKPEWYYIEDGEPKVSSAAFRDRNNEVSVNVAALTTHEQALQGRPLDGLASIQASTPRGLQHIISRTLEDDDPDDPSHRVICPPSGISKGKIKEAARLMAKGTTWILKPTSIRDQN